MTDFIILKVLRNMIFLYAVAGLYALAATMGLVPAAPVSPIGTP